MKVLILCFLIAGALARPEGRPLHKRGYAQIVGGTDASPGEFPYQLSFQERLITGAAFHFCGGSIYNAQTSITAGHCVYGSNYNNPDTWVVAGEQDLSKTSGDEQHVDLSKIILHPQYDPAQQLNDIALLIGQQSFKFNSKVAAIPIPAQGASTTGNCVVTGWGTLSSGGSTPDVLQKVTVPIVSDAQCENDYPRQIDAPSMVCAGEQGKDSCQGDSGGPLACGGVLHGVVSWGIGCADAGHPGVYTEVAYFHNWIVNNAA